MRVLVVDDEREIADLVVDLLTPEGLDVEACYSGREALEAFVRRRPDLVVLDIMMPGMDGFEVCRRIREFSDVPIVFLSAKDQEVDKVRGLTLGADDYITKPFKPFEFVARIGARLRRVRTGDERPSALLAHGVELDPKTHTVSFHGEELDLTPTEFSILEVLLTRVGEPVSNKEIHQAVWDDVYLPSSANAVMVHIRNIRRKLAAIDGSDEVIQTVWGVGYRVAADAARSGSEI